MSLQKQKTQTETLVIQPFGECTLLPLDGMPEKIRTYEKVKVTAMELDLGELPALSHIQTQEIFKALVHKLSRLHTGIATGVSVWISGVHESYPFIDTDNKEQEPEECISVFELFFLDATRPMDMYIAEISTDEPRAIEGDDVVYCLFLGT